MRMQRRISALALSAVVMALCSNVALADYYLPDGRLVSYGGAENGKEYLNVDGQKVEGARTDNNRLVPASGIDTATRDALREHLPSQSVGGDGTYSNNTNTSVPIVQNGKVVGYGNAWNDSNGMGRTWTGTGNTTRDQFGNDVSWTTNGNGSTKLDRITVGNGTPANPTVPEPSGGSASPQAPSSPGGGGGGGAATPAIPEPDPSYETPDRRALSVSVPGSDINWPAPLQFQAGVFGNVAGAIRYSTSWGDQGTMTYNRSSGAYEAQVEPPGYVFGPNQITVQATLSQRNGNVGTHGPSLFTRTATVNLIGKRVAPDGEADPTYPELQGVPGTIMSLDQYESNCMSAMAPEWCALSDQAALTLQNDLQGAVAEAHYATVGQEKYLELARRIEATLVRNGVTDHARTWLPNGHNHADLLKMPPKRF